MTLLALALLLLPGLAWFAWSARRAQDPLVALAQIFGISLSAIILLAQFAFLLNVSFSGLGIGMILSVIAALAVIGFIRRGLTWHKEYRWHRVIGFGLFGAAIAWRLFQARALLLPNWVDSQHHFLIIRVILERGGLPDTLAPYLSGPFYYHYGFHVVTALLIALSGLEIGVGMLLLGQVLNAAISLSVYALGKGLWKDWRPAAAAALLVVFATRMPAYYLSWGRYTLVTGLILLPLAMALALRLLEKPHRWEDGLKLAVLTAGVLLSHYFTAALLALFLIILGTAHLMAHLNEILTSLRRVIRIAVSAAGGALLAAPWLIRVAQFSSASPKVSVQLPETARAFFTTSDRWDYIWQLLGPSSNHWLLLAGGMGLLFGLVRRTSLSFGVWSLLLAILTLPTTFTLSPFRPDHFAIILFLPLSLWAGYLFWRIATLASQRLKWGWVATALVFVPVIGWSAWGLPLSRDIINPVTVLVTEDDIDALRWIDANTPSDARFLINTTYWLQQIYRGSDGGGWILPYTGRWALVPTVFYSFSADPEPKLTYRRWGEQASMLTTCSEDFWALVTEADLDWVYVREGSGGLGFAGLEECEGIAEVYRNERVRVYSVGKD